jgi:hypothetical protein
MVIYCDVDGTLTTNGAHGWASPCPKVITDIKAAIEAGHEVIIWSARGGAYAKAFAEKNNLKAAHFLTKPDVMVDDNVNIRPQNRLWKFSPDDVKAGMLRKVLRLEQV